MEWLRLIGFCLLAGAMVMLLKQMQPQAAALLSVAFGVLLVGVLLGQIAEYIEAVRAFLDSLALDERYFSIMVRSMGVVLVTQLAAQACEDMGAQSVARHAEFAGRLALLGIAVPVFMELTQMAVDVLR